VGLWDRLRRRSAGERHEDAGELDEAAAARVLSTLADLASEPRQALELLVRARRMVPAETDVGRALARRYLRIRLDLARRSGVALPSELAAIGAELELVGDVAGAREALKLAGDREGETRLLIANGEIDALEETLSAEQDAARRAIRLKDALREVAALEAAGQRVRAIDLARRQDGPEARAAASTIEARLARPPMLRMEVLGKAARLILGDEVIVGRRDADLIVVSPVVSRHHLRLFRGADGLPWVEGLGAANGTVLAGARLSGAVPVHAPLSLSLGGEVPCVLTPGDAGLFVEIGGETILAPLGPGRAGPFAIAVVGDVYRLSPLQGGPVPLLDRTSIAEGLDLAIGDELRSDRDGPIVLKVLA
jgi:hypothetical protein